VKKIGQNRRKRANTEIRKKDNQLYFIPQTASETQKFLTNHGPS